MLLHDAVLPLRLPLRVTTGGCTRSGGGQHGHSRRCSGHLPHPPAAPGRHLLLLLPLLLLLHAALALQCGPRDRVLLLGRPGQLPSCHPQAGRCVCRLHGHGLRLLVLQPLLLRLLMLAWSCCQHGRLRQRLPLLPAKMAGHMRLLPPLCRRPC